MAARERWKMGKNFRHKVKWISGIAQQFPPHFCYGVLVLSAILLIFSWQSTVVALFRCYSIFKPEIQPLETTVDDWQSSGQAAMTTLWLMAFGLAAVVGCGFFFWPKSPKPTSTDRREFKIKERMRNAPRNFFRGLFIKFLWPPTSNWSAVSCSSYFFLAFLIFLDIFISLNYGALISELVQLFG